VSSYIVAIACMLAKRLRGEKLLPSRFNLGRSGIAINTIAIAFLSLAFVFLFFPAAPHPTAESMNWSILMFGSIVVFSLVYYYVYGRYSYVGPVELVKNL
jgi:choline transport protein